MNRIGFGIIVLLLSTSSSWGIGLFADDIVGDRTAYFPPRMEDGIYPRHYRPDRTVDMKHLRLEIRVDMDEREISGIVHLTVSPIHEHIDRVRLDCVGLSIDNIFLDKSLSLDYDYMPKQDELTVHLPDGTGEREEFTISVHYHGSPTRHFYWRNTEDPYSDAADQAFTLCEPRGASSWFPCLDYPSDRLTTEIVAVVPRGFTTIANGALLSKEISPDGEWETHHWSQGIPHVTYLVSLVVGHYGVVKEEWRGIPVEYYCMPGDEEDAEASMQVVEHVLNHEVNPVIVAILEEFGCRARGIHGDDILSVVKRTHRDPESDEVTDWGYVGTVTEVDTAPVEAFLHSGITPVVTPLGRGAGRRIYNVNADEAAAALAQALKARKLVFLSDVPGLLEDPDDPASLLSTVRTTDVDELIHRGVISGGMLPKVRGAVGALAAGVRKTHFIDASLPHSLLLELFTDKGVGTEIVK